MEIEIYKPDLDKIERLKADSFYNHRRSEFAKKIEEIKRQPNKKDILWVIYGWLLSTADEAEKIKPFVEDVPVLGFLLKYYCMIMTWQAKRLKIE